MAGSRAALRARSPNEYVAPLHGLHATFAGSNSDRFFDALHENLAVADLAGIRALRDGANDCVGVLLPSIPFDQYFRDEFRLVGTPSIDLAAAPAATSAFDLEERQPTHADRHEALDDRIELLLTNDRLNLRQRSLPTIVACACFASVSLAFRMPD